MTAPVMSRRRFAFVALAFGVIVAVFHGSGSSGCRVRLVNKSGETLRGVRITIGAREVSRAELPDGTTLVMGGVDPVEFEGQFTFARTDGSPGGSSFGVTWLGGYETDVAVLQINRVGEGLTYDYDYRPKANWPCVRVKLKRWLPSAFWCL